MRLIVSYRDQPEMMKHRAKHETAHFKYLEEHSDEIVIGGGLRNEPGGDFVGSLWVLEVESFERAEQLVQGDPYYNPAIREYEILVWGKAGNKDVVL